MLWRGVRCAPRSGPHPFGYTLGVAVNALHEMNIVRALDGFESGVHGFHVQPAIGKLWVTGGAGGPGSLTVPLVAGKATETFMHADRGAIVPRTHFHRRQRCVALVTEGLADIGADADGTVPIAHRGQRQSAYGHVVELATVEKRE